MLLEKIADYLDVRKSDYFYIKDNPRMEIWVTGKEWFPILISKLNGRGYWISWGEIEYRIKDEAKAYTHILQIVANINEQRNHD